MENSPRRCSIQVFQLLDVTDPPPPICSQDKPRAPRESVAGRLIELGRIASLPVPLALSKARAHYLSPPASCRLISIAGADPSRSLIVDRSSSLLHVRTLIDRLLLRLAFERLIDQVD
jgi:hypothetical protein